MKNSVQFILTLCTWMTSTYILNEPGSTKCNVNHHPKMTYTRTHVHARTRSRILETCPLSECENYDRQNAFRESYCSG